MELQRIYKSAFEAAHIIEGHPKCGIKHGHSYHLNAYFNGDSGIWVDFHDIKILIDTFINDNYDHHDLGNRTAEDIAAELAAFLGKLGYAGYLELYETEKFGVRIQFNEKTLKVATAQYVSNK